MPPTFTDEGLRAAVQIRKQIPGQPVLILSQYVERLYVDELHMDGGLGTGYLLKDQGVLTMPGSCAQSRRLPRAAWW